NFYSRPNPQEAARFTHGRLSPGHIDPALIRRRARFYLCGPDEMLSAFRERLKSMGVPAFEVFHERFTSPQRHNRGEQRQCEVYFSRQNRGLRWSPADGSLLELAERNGLTLPSGCRTGQCESCAVTVLSGEVGHYTEVDTDDEKHCLACQAYPVSDVVLDA